MDSKKPDYVEYYINTMLYILLIPFIITIIMAFISIILSFISIFIYTPIIVAFVTCHFVYICIGKSKFDKPDSLFALYLPVFIYLGWHLFLTLIFTILYFDGIGAILYALLSLNFYGINKFPDWQLVMIFNWIYNLSLLGGFVAGERLAFRKTRVMRKPFNIKYVCLILICCTLLMLINESIGHNKWRNIIEEDPVQNVYGFAYENGYYITDLEPYYVENEENILAKLDEPSIFTISEPTEMPILDGVEAIYPIYSAFAYACYEDIGEIQENAKKNNSKKPNITMPVRFNNSVFAFEDLIAGETDIFFCAKPSIKQNLLAANKAGKELVLTPIGKEALVFFVNIENPVDELTSDQIRDIYSGEIGNWKKIGGANKPIFAFQRPENSDSQTMMKYFMGDVSLKTPLQTKYVDSMGYITLSTISYQNSSSAIGYSFRYFANIMFNDMDYSDNIKYLSVDGVYPDEETIRSGEYPITTELYAVTLADNPNENVKLFLEWMTSPQGQQIVADTGYVAIQSP